MDFGIEMLTLGPGCYGDILACKQDWSFAKLKVDVYTLEKYVDGRLTKWRLCLFTTLQPEFPPLPPKIPTHTILIHPLAVICKGEGDIYLILHNEYAVVSVKVSNNGFSWDSDNQSIIGIPTPRNCVEPPATFNALPVGLRIIKQRKVQPDV